MLLKRPIVTIALALGAGALLAFGFGFLKAQDRKRMNETFERGYNLGAADTALKAAAEANELRRTLEEQNGVRENEMRERLQDLEESARVSQRQAYAALQELINSDPDFAQCEVQILPDSVRRHHPYGVLPSGETAATDSSDN